MVLFQPHYLDAATVRAARIDAPVPICPLDLRGAKGATEHAVPALLQRQYDTPSTLPPELYAATMRHLLAVPVLRLAHAAGQPDEARTGGGAEGRRDFRPFPSRCGIRLRENPVCRGLRPVAGLQRPHTHPSRPGSRGMRRKALHRRPGPARSRTPPRPHRTPGENSGGTDRIYQRGDIQQILSTTNRRDRRRLPRPIPRHGRATSRWRPICGRRGRLRQDQEPLRARHAMGGGQRPPATRRNCCPTLRYSPCRSYRYSIDFHRNSMEG